MSDANKEYTTTGWCSTTEPYSYLYNFPASSLTSYHYNLCETMTITASIFGSFSVQLMLISVIILILITFLGQHKEDYNWFIFNNALLNLVYGILFEVFIIFHASNNYVLLMLIMVFFINLATSSIFLLAFNRFLNLYFPIYYRKFFTQFRIFLWILFFDFFIMCILVYIIYNHIGIHSIHIFSCQTVVFFSLTSTLIFSSLVIRKLQQFMQTCKKGSKSLCRTRDDIRRAAIVCIWQTIMAFLHSANVIFDLIFVTFLRADPKLFETLYPVYIVTSLLQHPLYQVFVISDTFVTMFLMKSYRSAAIRVYKRVVEMLPNTSRIHAIQISHVECIHGQIVLNVLPARRKSAF